MPRHITPFMKTGNVVSRLHECLAGSSCFGRWDTTKMIKDYLFWLSGKRFQKALEPIFLLAYWGLMNKP